jgi:cytochrome c2
MIASPPACVGCAICRLLVLAGLMLVACGGETSSDVASVDPPATPRADTPTVEATPTRHSDSTPTTQPATASTPTPTSAPQAASTNAPVASPTSAFTSTPEPPTPTDVVAPAGQFILEQKCGMCHGVQGTAAQGQIGPDLTYFASQALIADTVENNAANLWDWLANPSAIKPGTSMPNMGLFADEISLLVQYLYSLNQRTCPATRNPLASDPVRHRLRSCVPACGNTMVAALTISGPPCIHSGHVPPESTEIGENATPDSSSGTIRYRFPG